MSPREPKPTLTATYTYLRRRRAGPAAYPAPARLTPTRSHLGRSRTSGGAAAAAVLMVPLAPVPGSRTRPNGRSRRRCGRPGSRGRHRRIRWCVLRAWSAPGSGGGPRGGPAAACRRLASAAWTLRGRADLSCARLAGRREPREAPRRPRAGCGAPQLCPMATLE